VGRRKVLRLLLDTHALLWWATLNSKLSSKARKAIGAATTEVFVSAASGWEIATKVRLGKLEWPVAAGSVGDYVIDQGFRTLAITLAHAELAGQIRIDSRDPFDRMLIAKAQLEDLWLASNEAIFDAAGVRRYW
jgi:PIN domain nuclease of toxin-antitoxin system